MYGYVYVDINIKWQEWELCKEKSPCVHCASPTFRGGGLARSIADQLLTFHSSFWDFGFLFAPAGAKAAEAIPFTSRCCPEGLNTGTANRRINPSRIFTSACEQKSQEVSCKTWTAKECQNMSECYTFQIMHLLCMDWSWPQHFGNWKHFLHHHAEAQLRTWTPQARMQKHPRTTQQSHPTRTKKTAHVWILGHHVLPRAACCPRIRPASHAATSAAGDAWSASWLKADWSVFMFVRLYFLNFCRTILDLYILICWTHTMGLSRFGQKRCTWWTQAFLRHICLQNSNEWNS